jgi:hypothetical protein
MQRTQWAPVGDIVGVMRWTVCGRLGCSPATQRRDRAGISIWQRAGNAPAGPACPACNGANEWIKSVGAAAARALTAPAPFHLCSRPRPRLPHLCALLVCLRSSCATKHGAAPPRPNTTIHSPQSTISTSTVISASAPALAPAPIHTLHTATTRPP